MAPPFGLPVMYEYLRIVRKLEPWFPPLEFGQKNGLDLSEDLFFFWSSPKSGQKNGVNRSEGLFLVFIFLI